MFSDLGHPAVVLASVRRYGYLFHDGLPYRVGVRNLPLMTSGICQYLSPTLGIFCGMILGESLTKEKLVSFCFIWAGVILYTLNSIYEEKRRCKTAA